MDAMLIMQIVIAVMAAILILPPLVSKAIRWYKTSFAKNKSVFIGVDTSNKDDFATIVQGWETFVNLLVRNDMTECTEDMKTLLVKMAEEYRKELNDKKVIESALDSIIIKKEV